MAVPTLLLLLARLGRLNDALSAEVCGHHDLSMTVSRVFGESYQADGVTIVPVATVRGGGGGGGGEGTPPGGEGTGTGAGLGFGVIVRPLGVYIVKDGEVRWQPAIDVLRVVVGGQLLALAAILAFRRRRKRR